MIPKLLHASRPLLVCLLAIASARAETPIEYTDDPLWEIRLAGYAQYDTAYPASSESQFNAVPLPFPIFRGKILRIGDETEKPVTTRIFRRDRVKLDFDFGLNFPVDSDDIDARDGMPDLDWLLEAGPELELQFVETPGGGRMYLALQLRGAVSMDGLDPEWRGLIASSELIYIRPLRTPATELKFRLTPEIASSDYMDFFYGVDETFATSTRPAYEARAGYLGTRISLSLKHDFTDRFEIRTGVRLGLHQGARNEDSPLFTRDVTSGIYIAFLYKYWESKRRAEAF